MLLSITDGMKELQQELKENLSKGCTSTSFFCLGIIMALPLLGNAVTGVQGSCDKKLHQISNLHSSQAAELNLKLRRTNVTGPI